MPTQDPIGLYYRCDLCIFEYKTWEEAKQCEDQPMNYAFAVGDIVYATVANAPFHYGNLSRLTEHRRTVVRCVVKRQFVRKQHQTRESRHIKMYSLSVVDQPARTLLREESKIRRESPSAAAFLLQDLKLIALQSFPNFSIMLPMPFCIAKRYCGTE